MNNLVRKTINVTTDKGLVLSGVLFQGQSSPTIFIALTGVEGNINNNRFFTSIGNTLASHNIDFIVAHTQDAFNQVKRVNGTANDTAYGARSEKFSDAIYDAKAYLNFAKKQGYQHLILGGQSLGANKAIYYLSQTNDDTIDHFFLLSPVNIENLRSSIPKSQKDVITEQMQQGQGKSLLPFKLFRWLKTTVENADRWLHDNTLNNVHPDNTGDFSQIEKINQDGALLIGTHDGFTGGKPVSYLNSINSHFNKKNVNKIVFIKDASHIYRHQEPEVANKVLEIIKEWY